MTENSYYCTDEDSKQYVKRISAKKFRFIEAVWIDAAGSEQTGNELDNYVVIKMTVDVDELSLNDIEHSVGSFYGSVTDMMDSYGMRFEELYNIIAECYFETMCLREYDFRSEVLPWDEAVKLIEKIISQDKE